MRIGFVSGSGDAFLNPVLDHWRARGHELLRVEQWPAPVDLLFIEWADQNLPHITKALKRVPIIVRLHSFEAFTPYPGQTDWAKVDDLIFVADHVRDHVLETFEPKGPEFHVVPNAVDFDRWPVRHEPIRVPGAGRKIAWVGGISHKKGPELFVQAAIRLLLHDDTATIHMAGDWQDPRYLAYFRHAMPRALAERVEYHGKVPHEVMPDWLRDMDAILSTSPWESFQYAVAEGVARGLLPLVHDWPGAREVYPFGRIWKTVDDLVAAYDEPWTPDDAARARAYLEEHHRAADRFADLDRIIEERVAKGCRRPLPTVSVAMLVGGMEPRFRAAVESVAGHVDEIVCHVDTRKGRFNVEVAKELRREGVPISWTHGEPVLYHGKRGAHIDFSGTRNEIASRCKSDWIFVLDSDELVEDAGLIRPILADAQAREYSAAACAVDCYTDQGLSESAKDVRFYRRGAGIAYRFPVHNQLSGFSGVYGCEMKIRSTYVGGLVQRCDRSIPPLLDLWDEAVAAIEAGAEKLTINGIDVDPVRARGHAAFFLARMYTAGQDWDEAMRWYRICEEIVPAERYAAPAWKWYSLRTMDASGLTAAEQVVEKALEIHPAHADVLHNRLGFDLIRWVNAAIDERAMPGVPMSSRRFLPGVQAAIRALGLPVTIRTDGLGGEAA